MLAPEQTLFGPIETKTQSRNRAKRIVQLLGTVEDAPLAIRCCEYDIQMLGYFIERSEHILLDPNDRDGLLRLVGDLQELLTEEDCRDMLEKEAIWRPYPLGWMGSWRGQMYPAALHPKEVAYLRQLRDQCSQDIEDIVAALESSKSELAQLQKIGPLPQDIADRYALTTEGAHRPVPAKQS